MRDRNRMQEFLRFARSSRGLLATTMCFALLTLPASARSDRGAFSVDGGVVFSAARVPAGIGAGDAVNGTFGGAGLGVRYALSNNVEIGMSGAWFEAERFYNDNTTIVTPNGIFSGQLQSSVQRMQAGLGVHFVTGFVWRLRVGAELGWSRVVFRRLDLVDVAGESRSRSFGLALGDRTVDSIVIAPMAGVEWMVSDHVSLVITPWLELPVNGGLAAVTVPITLRYSWYML
jgi:hypothetical protein